MELPLDRFLNLVYHFATLNAEEKDRNRFDIKLNMPPIAAVRQGRVDKASPWSAESETNALSSLAAALGGGHG